MMTLHTILLATDFSETSGAALIYARQLARTFGSTLHVLHVTADVMASMVGTEMYTADYDGLQAQIDQDARKQLQAIADGSLGGLRVETVVVTSSSPADAIVFYAREHGIDLIVLGTHGRSGVRHLFLGSVAERVVRIAVCPVLTVRPHALAVVPQEAVPVSVHA